uniref:Uncharacterized protein n=1 Tax=Rhizophora mucronata TaxID=61149 RepID=A0A2P2P6X9_RHIMU
MWGYEQIKAAEHRRT